ncbi:MAG TPA: hypothetical protein VN688_33415 [Gemmataceae bacterium]|nr:hypothetical protein [Gemmataceae bacterium]
MPPKPQATEAPEPAPTMAQRFWRLFHDLGIAPRDPGRLEVEVKWGDGHIRFHVWLDPAREPGGNKA